MTAAGIPALLEPIQERLNAATPGPWQWSPEEDVWGDCGPNLETVERGPVYSDGSQGASVTVIGSWGHDANGISVEDHDAVFIAAAPTDTARLLAAVKAVLEVSEEPDVTLRHPKGDKTFYVEAHRIRSAVKAALRGEA